MRNRKGAGLVAIVVAGVVAGAAAQAPRTMNALTDEEKAAGWRLLFDGATTAGWRGFGKPDMPAGWAVADGALTRVGPGGDIVTTEVFDSFELAFDWRLAPGGNSGVFFGVGEDAKAAWHTGPEYQILDNAAHKDGLKPETSAASNYALHAPSRDLTRPPGQWNESRLLVRGAHVEHWLNGEKVVEYELGSPDWAARVAKSKFKEHPGYGRVRPGRIALQDHGDRVAFRNIRIRVPAR